jgi:hypothetical protein
MLYRLQYGRQNREKNKYLSVFQNRPLWRIFGHQVNVTQTNTSKLTAFYTYFVIIQYVSTASGHHQVIHNKLAKTLKRPKYKSVKTDFNDREIVRVQKGLRLVEDTVQC